MSISDAPSFDVVRSGTDTATISLKGRLDARTLSTIWARVVEPIRSSPPKALTVDLEGVSYCDGAGIGLLVELDTLVRAAGGRVSFEHIAEGLRGILDLALLKDPAAALGQGRRREGAVSQIGRATAGVLGDVRAIVAFTGEMTVVLLWALTHPHRVRWADMVVASEKTGANAVPVVCLLGFLVGLIIAFQCVAPLRSFGAESMIPTVIAIAIVRELGPLMAAIILAGRSGSAFAAEIGTMKVTEELDALSTFGLDPTRFLVVPRVLAAALVTPLLSVFSSLMGVLGGYVVMASLGYSFSFYVDATTQAIDYVDFLQGVAKSVVFAMLVSGIGCLRGLRTTTGPGAVGDSTTRAVVTGIVLIVFADAILGTFFYSIGI